MAMRVAAVVLAAGKSERMGKNKLLLEMKGKKLIEHILEALESSKVDEIVVVLGHNPWEVTDVISRFKCSIVVNEMYMEGMVSSLKTGLKQVERTDAVLIVLGDQIILNPKLIDVMIGEMEKNRSGVFIVSPIYRGKKGHPILFHKRLFNEILSLTKYNTLRDVIHKHSNRLLTIEGDKWTIIDIDDPNDFDTATRLLDENALN